MSIRLFFTLTFFVLVAGCKKADENRCENVLCLHGNCEEGECVCPVNYTEADCSQCAADWGGTRCQVNMSTYIGRYHVTGFSQDYNHLDTAPHIPTYIDGFFDVVRDSSRSKSLLFYDNSLYLLENTPDSATWTKFYMSYSGSYYYSLRFKKDFDDSLFYYSQRGGLGAGTTTNLTGVKIQ